MEARERRDFPTPQLSRTRAFWNIISLPLMKMFKERQVEKMKKVEAAYVRSMPFPVLQPGMSNMSTEDHKQNVITSDFCNDKWP